MDAKFLASLLRFAAAVRRGSRGPQAWVVLIGLALTPRLSAVNIYSRVSVTLDSSLDLTPAQRDDLASAVAAHMASRIAVTEGWKCVQPPSVKPPDSKEEAIFAQADNQLFEIVTLQVNVTRSEIHAGIWRKTAPGRETSLASYSLPVDVPGLGQRDALEGKLADLLSLAVDAAMSQAHPCGRWTGQVEYRARRTGEAHTDMSDASSHRSLDITIKLTNQGNATAHAHLEERGTSEGRIRAFVDGATTIVRNSWQTWSSDGDGVTRATVRVMTVPENKTYTIWVSIQPITARKHVEGGARNSPPSHPSDVEFAVTWPGTGYLQGKLDDPVHLHGKITLIDRKTDTTTETEVEEWDLQWEQ